MAYYAQMLTVDARVSGRVGLLDGAE